MMWVWMFQLMCDLYRLIAYQMSRKIALHLREFLLSRVDPKQIENLKGDRKFFLTTPKPKTIKK